MPSDLEFYNHRSAVEEGNYRFGQNDSNDEDLYYNAKNAHSLKLFGEIVSTSNHNIW